VLVNAALDSAQFGWRWKAYPIRAIGAIALYRAQRLTLRASPVGAAVRALIVVACVAWLLDETFDGTPEFWFSEVEREENSDEPGARRGDAERDLFRQAI